MTGWDVLLIVMLIIERLIVISRLMVWVHNEEFKGTKIQARRMAFVPFYWIYYFPYLKCAETVKRWKNLPEQNGDEIL